MQETLTAETPRPVSSGYLLLAPLLVVDSLHFVFARLLLFPNVIVTGHQAFFTHNAVGAIAETTLSNITAFENGTCQNALTCSIVRKE